MRLSTAYRPTGDALHAVVYDHMIPNAEDRYAFSAGSDWSQGPPITSGVGPSLHDATMGLEGDLWFLSMASIPGRTIGKIDGVTGRFTSFVSLGERAGTNGRSHAIITARDGTIWFNHARGPQLLFGELGFMDPRTNATGRVAGPEITVKPVISSAPGFLHATHQMARDRAVVRGDCH